MINLTQEQVMQNWGVDNSDTPLVSVRCITYNHEQYIAQALDGFLMQKTTFPFEVIVHDDASTDNTANIIREYETKFPKIVKPIYETENQWSKPGNALGKIVNASLKGKYVAICEGDDYWIDNNKLQMQVDFLETNPDYGMCYTSFNILYQNSGIIEKDLFNTNPVKYKSDYTLDEWVYKTGYIAPMSWVFKKELYDKKPEIETLDGSFVLVATFIHETKIKCFKDNVTCVYRVLNESAAHSRDLFKIYLRNKSIIATQIELVKRYNLLEETKNECEQKYYHTAFKVIACFEPYEELYSIYEKIKHKTKLERIIIKIIRNVILHRLFITLYTFYWRYFGYKKN